jgi:hypothetical protein
MNRLILAVSLAVALAGCGSSDGGKKDAASLARDTAASADMAPALDAMTDTSFGDSWDLGTPADSAAPDAGALDAATDGPTVSPDAPAEDVPPDLQPDLAADASPDAGPDAVAMCGNIRCDCTFSKNGKTYKLYGKYRVDDIFPDFTVREVTFNEDLKVRKVGFSPDACGKWERDDVFYDFKIRIVTFNEDFKIRYVDFSEGLP